MLVATWALLGLFFLVHCIDADRISSSSLLDVSLEEINDGRTAGSGDAGKISSSLQPSSRSLVDVSLETNDGDALCSLFTAANQNKLTNWCGTKSNGNYVNGPCTGTTAWLGVSCTNGVVQKVDLADKGLQGSLPTTLSLLTGGLTDLLLSDNSLTGTIPFQFGSLTKMGFLNLSRNKLSGTLPSSLGALTKMFAIYVQGNSLTGPIPTSFCSLNIKGLDMFFGDNKLTCYPSCLLGAQTFFKDASLVPCAAGTLVSPHILLPPQP